MPASHRSPTRPPARPRLPEVDAVIFDLGNVLCRFDFAHAFRTWSEVLSLPESRLREVVRFDDWVDRYERGHLDTDTYHRHVADSLGVDLSPHDFASGWNAIFEGEIPGMAEVVAATQTRVRTVVLSNTNALHASFWREAYAGILSGMERVFTSHEIGHRKPDPDAYRVVLDYLGLPPSRVAFFDDQPTFVDGARALGIRARQASDAAGVARDLVALGVLPSA